MRNRQIERIPLANFPVRSLCFIVEVLRGRTSFLHPGRNRPRVVHLKRKHQWRTRQPRGCTVHPDSAVVSAMSIAVFLAAVNDHWPRTLGHFFRVTFIAVTYMMRVTDTATCGPPSWRPSLVQKPIGEPRAMVDGGLPVRFGRTTQPQWKNVGSDEGIPYIITLPPGAPPSAQPSFLVNNSI